MREIVNIFSTDNYIAPSSFLIQSTKLAAELVNMGYEVHSHNIYTKEDVKKADYNIYVPWHYSVTYKNLHIRPPYSNESFPDKSKLDFDLIPDSTLVGICDKEDLDNVVREKVIQKNYKKFIVSSKMQDKIFHLPNTKVIPWTVNPEIVTYKKFLEIDKDVPIVFIDGHTDYLRRGIDVSFKVLDALYNEGYKFGVVVHQWGNEFTLGDRPYTVKMFNGFLSDYVYYGILASCTHFLSPLRGGSFEILSLEALALGLTVVIPENSPSSEIPLRKDDVYWCRYNGNKIKTWENIFHKGGMNDIDYESTLEAMRKALEKPKVIDNYSYLSHYSMRKWAKEYLSD